MGTGAYPQRGLDAGVATAAGVQMTGTLAPSTLGAGMTVGDVQQAGAASKDVVNETGTAAMSENGSMVTAKGETSVSAAADKKSGAVSANGKDGALAAATTGATIGLGLSKRAVEL